MVRWHPVARDHNLGIGNGDGIIKLATVLLSYQRTPKKSQEKFIQNLFRQIVIEISGFQITDISVACQHFQRE